MQNNLKLAHASFIILGFCWNIKNIPRVQEYKVILVNYYIHVILITDIVNLFA